MNGSLFQRLITDGHPSLHDDEFKEVGCILYLYGYVQENVDANYR